MINRIKKVIEKLEELEEHRNSEYAIDEIINELELVRNDLSAKNENCENLNNNFKKLESELKAVAEELNSVTETNKLRTEELSTILRTIPAFVYFKDTNLKYILVNEHFSELVGVPPENLIGKTVFDIFPDYDDKNYLEREMYVLSTGKSIFDIEEKFSLRDRTFYVNTSISAIVNQEMEIKGIIGIAWDITERKIAEEEIRHQAGLIISLLDSIPDLIFYKDINGVYFGCNTPFMNLVNKSKEEIVGFTDYDLFDKETADFFREKDKEILEGLKAKKNEEWVNYPDGRRRLLETYKTPYYGVEGDLKGVLGISRDITDRELATEMLKESEQKYRTLIDNSLEGILIISFHGEILFANKTIVKMMENEDKNPILGRSVFEFLSQVSVPKALEDFLNVAMGKDSYIAEYELMVNDNQKVFVESIGKIIDYNGEKAIMVFLRDVTMQYIAKEELLESEMLQRTLLENIAVGVLIIDPETRLIEKINSFACKIIGKPGEEIVGNRCHKFVCPAEENNCPICDHNQTIDNSDKILIKSDGSKIPILKTVKKITIKGKEKLLESFIDITARKKAEEQIEKYASDLQKKNEELNTEIEFRLKAEEEVNSLAEFQSILMNIASGYINIDFGNVAETILKSLSELSDFIEADRGYLFTYNMDNDTASCLYEWCREGIPSTVAGLKDIPNSSHQQWIDSHRKGETLYLRDISELNENDTIRLRLDANKVKTLIAIPIMDGYNCLGFVGFDSVIKRHEYSENEKRLLFVFTQILLNFLKRTALEESLIKEKENANQANKAKSEFLANMSHEIRTPMNAILGFSEIMLNTTEDERQKSFLKTVLDSGKTLLSLINDILDLSKIEAGRMDISLDATDMRVILSELKQIFRQKTEEKGLDLIIDYDTDIPESFLIDEVRLRQILINLIGNAVKFTHKGYIKIEAALTERKPNGTFDFQISVEDTGIGISENFKDKVFDAFTQQEGQDTKTYGGTGLGLAITKRICELMNGEISLESTLGKGSKFTLIFRNIQSLDNSVEKQNIYLWSEEKIKFKFATILIVDDIPHNRSLVKAFLENFDFALLEAEDGNIAVNYAKVYKPDLILMDIRMPIMNGYEANEILKNNPNLSNIPVIALTASTMTSEIDKVNKSFDGYIRKPVQRKILINELMKFLPYSVIEGESFTHEIFNKKDDKTKLELLKSEITAEIREEFNSNFIEAIKTQLEVVDIDEMRNLISLMDTFCEEKNLIEFRKSIGGLKTSFESFDMDSLQLELELIKNIIE